MKKNRFYLLAGVLGLFVTTLAVSSFASAYQGGPNVQGPGYDPVKHEAMVEAIDGGDYQAWVELHQGRGRISEVITEDNFDQFTAMHGMMVDGDYEGANAIRDELGLPEKGKQFSKGFRMGMRAGDCTRGE
jgi:hypothetical protein